jgi:chaperonin cofactor prefoldin
MIQLRNYLQGLIMYRQSVDNTIRLVQSALQEYDELFTRTEVLERRIKQLEKELAWRNQVEAARLNAMFGPYHVEPIEESPENRGHWIYRDGETKRVD